MGNLAAAFHHVDTLVSQDGEALNEAGEIDGVVWQNAYRSEVTQARNNGLQESSDGDDKNIDGASVRVSFNGVGEPTENRDTAGERAATTASNP